MANGNFVGGLEGEKSSQGDQVKNNLYIGNIINEKETEYTGALFRRYSSLEQIIFTIKIKLMV